MDPNGQMRVSQNMLLGQKAEMRISETPGPLEASVSGMVNTRDGPLLFVKGGATRLEKIAKSLLGDHISRSGECGDEDIQDAVDRAAKLLDLVQKRLTEQDEAAKRSSKSPVSA